MPATLEFCQLLHEPLKADIMKNSEHLEVSP